MELSYLLEIDMIIALMAGVILFQVRSVSAGSRTSSMVFSQLLVQLILICALDGACSWFGGRWRTGMVIGCTLYYYAVLMGSYYWFLYILVRLETVTNLRRTAHINGIPAMILGALIAFNGKTGYFFTVDDQGIYHRQVGIGCFWIVLWVYLAISVWLVINRVFREKSRYRRHEYLGYVFFSVPLAAAGLLQMCFFGLPAFQAGYLVSAVLVFSAAEQHQLLRDELTGLGNRNALLKYEDMLLAAPEPAVVTIFMMDMDRFKNINDAFGHLRGDKALQEMAAILRDTAESFGGKRLGAFRYSGDEFLMMGAGLEPGEVLAVESGIRERMTELNRSHECSADPCLLSVSLGTCTQLCRTAEDIRSVLEKADDNMYRVKRVRKYTTGRDNKG